MRLRRNSFCRAQLCYSATNIGGVSVRPSVRHTLVLTQQMYRRRYEKLPLSESQSALGKHKIRSLERGYLSHCRNSVKNCFPAQNFTEIGQSVNKERIVRREIHLRTTGRQLSMGSHMQYYLPPDMGDRPAFTPTGQVGTRFIDPVRMKG